MDAPSADQPPPHPTPSPAALSYQSPGAHQKSQWITDEQASGKVLMGCAIVAAVVAAVLGGIAALVALFLGWI